MFFRLCSAATPVIYPLFHSSIRLGYKNAIKKLILRKKPPQEAEEKEAPIEMKKKFIKSRDYFNDL